MKILFCGLKYEYGKPHLGPSAIEYATFFETLKRMPGIECDFFGMDEKILEVGRDVVDAELIKTVEETKPDLLFCFLFTDQIKVETIEYITKKTKTKTFNWFADDHWRFPIYSRRYAPAFTAISTTDSLAVKKYKALGINNVIKTQWAANTAVYTPKDKALNVGKYNITFVGANYGNRSGYINYLTAKKLPTEGFGNKWPAGRVSQEQMLEIFSFSKINLNFTESPYMTAKDRLKVLAKLLVRKQGDKFKFDGHHILDNFKSAIGTQRRQIKGRTFEVPACGGFLMTGPADNLEEYYIPGKEIVIFADRKDLVEKCKYYLTHENERLVIAKAGYERTIKEHTYEQRFGKIFKAMNLV
jgi:spore maturation protein CgeB